MNLKEYFAREKIKCFEFAEKLDVHPNYMCSLATGRLKPSRRLARDIEKATNGDVRLETRGSGSQSKE